MTIDIAGTLLAEAEALAAERGTTVHDLVEEGLGLAIARHRGRHGFALLPAAFGGGGLQTGVSLERWDEIRALIYGGNGG